MNGEANSIEVLPEFLPTGRIELVKQPAVSRVFAPIERLEEVPALAESRPRLALAPTELRTEQVWETLTYVVIWLCGCIAIGLCFV